MMQGLPSCMAFITALFIFNMMPGLLGLKDVKILTPKGGFVSRGSDLRLACHYNLQNDTLYAIKWYKGPPPFKEFYRYLPKESPPSKAFNIVGLYVDVPLSNDHEVYLRNVSFQTSGVYKCSVAAEFPFETRESTSSISVVVIGEEAPILRVNHNRSQYHPGDLISLECQTPPSYPYPANITWYLNGVKNHGRVLKTETRKDAKDPVTKSTISIISFDLPDEKVAPVKIYCQGTILTVYDKMSNITTIYPVPRRLTGTETLLHSGSSRASKESILFLCWILLKLVNFPLVFNDICSIVF